jgi:hypothetical protein
MITRESADVLVTRWALMVIPLLLDRADERGIRLALAAEIRIDLARRDDIEDAQLINALMRVTRELSESLL